MKKKEIMVGKTYTNGRGRERKVIGMGPEYKSYPSQESTENLQYEIVKDGSKTNWSAGQRANMTVASFASWAKEIVEEGHNAP